MRACDTVEVAVTLPGASVVVTLGHSFCADSRGESNSAEQGVSVVVASAVRTVPVSGCGSIFSSGTPMRSTRPEMP